MINLIIIILALGLTLYLFSNTHILVQQASTQNIISLSTLDTPNTNENLNTEYKTYI